MAKGLLLIGGQAAIDVNITAAIVCDVCVSLDLKKFPPELKIEPKVKELILTRRFQGPQWPHRRRRIRRQLRNDLKEIAAS